MSMSKHMYNPKNPTEVIKAVVVKGVKLWRSQTGNKVLWASRWDGQTSPSSFAIWYQCASDVGYAGDVAATGVGV